MTAPAPQGLGAIFGRMLDEREDRQLILPHIETSIVADNWPDKYTIEIDSEDYYGLTDIDGLGGKGGTGDGFAHPTSHTLIPICELWRAFDLSQPPPPRRKWNLNTLMSMSVGTAIHGILQTQMTMSGLIANPEKVTGDIEHEYRDTHKMVRGRIDAIVTLPEGGRRYAGPKAVVDIKTASSRWYDMTTRLTPSYEIQVLLGMEATDIDLGILLLVEAAYPWRMREMRVRPNPTMLQEFHDRWRYVRQCLERGELPRCDHFGKNPCLLRSV